MKSTFRMYAIVSFLVSGVVAAALVIQRHDADIYNWGHIPMQIACASGGIGSGCENNGVAVQLGTIVVTPTQAEERYLASHDLFHDSSMLNTSRNSSVLTAGQAEKG